MSPAHFWFGLSAETVLVQQVWRNVERVIAAGRHPLTGEVFVECPRGMCLRVLTTDIPFWRIHCLAIVACNDEKETSHTTVTD